MKEGRLIIINIINKLLSVCIEQKRDNESNRKRGEERTREREIHTI